MIDFQSATWHNLREHAEKRLESARLRNDDPSLNPEQTAALRGEIRVWKEVLGLPQLYAAERGGLPIDGA